MASADGGIGHGVGDFTNVMNDAVNKSLLIGFAEAEDTYSGWTNRAELNDFRATPRVDISAFAELPEVGELGEIPATTLQDRGVTAQLGKYGGRFGVSMEMIVNDDVGAITKIPRKQGHAARRTVANHVYRILTTNPAIGGFDLFSAEHNTTHAAEIDADGLDTLRGAMRRQTMPTGGDGDANEPTHMLPRFMLVPPELYGYALELAVATYADGGGINVWAGSLEVIEETRLSNASHWYLAASGIDADTIEVAYLQGREEPMLDNMKGWTVMGTEFRVVLVFAVTLRDYRGLQRGTGGAPS